VASEFKVVPTSIQPFIMSAIVSKAFLMLPCCTPSSSSLVTFSRLPLLDFDPGWSAASLLLQWDISSYLFPRASPKRLPPFPVRAVPGVDQLILEQQEKRTHQVTKKRGQAKGEEEPGFVVRHQGMNFVELARFIAALKKNSGQPPFTVC